MGDGGEEEQRAWEEARCREGLASDLLKRHPKRLTIKAVEAAAWELRLSRATMYRVTRSVPIDARRLGAFAADMGTPERISDPDGRAGGRHPGGCTSRVSEADAPTSEHLVEHAVALPPERLGAAHLAHGQSHSSGNRCAHQSASPR